MGKQGPRAGHKGSPFLVDLGARLGAPESILGILLCFDCVVVHKEGIEEPEPCQRIGVGGATLERHPSHVAGAHELFERS